MTVPTVPLSPMVPPAIEISQEDRRIGMADRRVDFADARPAFRRMVLRGAMLELVTAGFYRFWLATDMRRHLWSHTSVDGDAPEYVGTAKELLIGFLFALAILLPAYLGYLLLGLEAEIYQAYASMPLGLLYYVFMQFAIYRARRYRLTRTVWRGVRFSMTGSGLNYAWRVGLWSLLVFVSLGLALPWRQAALERFKMRYTAYGHLRGRFEGTGGQLFRRGWGLWLALWVLVLLPIVLGYQSKPWLAGLASIVLLFALPFVYAMYKAIEWRWWVSGIRFGDVEFQSDMGRAELIDLYWKVLGWSLPDRSRSGDLVQRRRGHRLHAGAGRHAATEVPGDVAALGLHDCGRGGLCRRYPGVLGGDAHLSASRHLAARGFVRGRRQS